MDKLIDRFSDILTNVLNHPERIYHYLVRWIQVMCALDILFLVKLLRIESLEFSTLGAALLEVFPWVVVYVLVLALSQVSLRLMAPPSNRGVSALLLLSIVGLVAAPITSITLMITIFTPPFQRLVKGNEPEWYVKIQAKFGLSEPG